jgi:D-apiose dehydrogenase
MNEARSSSPALRGLFLGTGHFAPLQLEAWRSVPNAHIVGVVGRRREAASALAQRFGIAASGDDLPAMIATLRPDFVDVCTAVEAHADQIRSCVAAGVPVLCQKPLAPTLEEAREIVALCAGSGVPLMVNDNWRWQPWYRELKRILAAGTLGSPRSVYHTLRTGDGLGLEPYPEQPYFRTQRRFLLLETGIHYLDTYRFLFGEPSRLLCHTRRGNPRIAGEDTAVVVLDFAGGPLVIFDANRAVPTERRRPPVNGSLRLECTEGSLDIDPDGAITLRPAGHPPLAHPYTIPPGYRGGSIAAALAHFCDGLRSGGRFETDGSDYLRTTELVFAAYRSADANDVLTATA